jgi:hypothetical protein
MRRALVAAFSLAVTGFALWIAQTGRNWSLR